MRPKARFKTGQADIFRSRLDQIIVSGRLAPLFAVLTGAAFRLRLLLVGSGDPKTTA
jgi:hypothetical protein